MFTRRLIRKTIESWRAWRLHRAVRRRHPELRHIDEAIQSARRRHAPVADLQAAQRAYMHSALRGQI